MDSRQKYWTAITNPGIKEMIESFRHPTKLLGAEAFLIKPFQRVTKYKSLISPILAKTNPEHPDYIHLQEA